MATQIFTDLTKHILSTVAEFTIEQVIIDKAFSVRTRSKVDALNSTFAIEHNNKFNTLVKLNSPPITRSARQSYRMSL